MADKSVLRVAFAGFRHGHIFDLYNAVAGRDDLEIVACCEEDAGVRDELAKGGRINITHSKFNDLLSDASFDVLAVGDVYAKRGEMVIKALRSGKHVVSDKPICTTLEQIAEIAKLCKDKNLCLGMQLDLRSYGVYHTMRKIIRDGRIGQVLSASFTGQHPLNPKVRPAWYFEDGMHGGTINDIAIHGMDMLPWMTGLTILKPVCARVWNSHCDLNKNFQDGAQLMLEMENRVGVLADVSYHSPDHAKGMPPQYWRFTVFGSAGLAETSLIQKDVIVIEKDNPQLQRISGDEDVKWRYLSDFLACIAGTADHGMLTTKDIIAATEMSLKTQQLADSSSAR